MTKMRRMRTMRIRLFKKLDWIPRLMSIFLVVAAIGSLLYIYLNGRKGLESASQGELYMMSREIDPDIDYHENNVRISKTFSCLAIDPVLRTADGVALSGNIAAPYYNLVGQRANGNTRYLLDVYRKEALNASYNPLYGIRQIIPRKPPVIDLTIRASMQEAMYKYYTQHGIKGCLYAYDYETGEVLCAVSTPGCDSDAPKEGLEDGSLLNKALYSTPPGSTMKIVTMMLLADQTDLSSLTYECQGSVEIDGNTYRCTGNHGLIDASRAIGVSCNCFFSQAVHEHLRPDRVIEVLLRLGWNVNGVTLNNVKSTSETEISGVYVSPGAISINPAGWDFSSIWSLIGETTVIVSPSWMAEFGAVAVAGAGVRVPRFRSDESPISRNRWQPYLEAITTAGEIWQRGYDDVIGDSISAHLTAGKTGTFELGGGNVQKTYLGVSRDFHTAFFLTIENYRVGEVEKEVDGQDVARSFLALLENVKKEEQATVTIREVE